MRMGPRPSWMMTSTSTPGSMLIAVCDTGAHTSEKHAQLGTARLHELKEHQKSRGLFTQTSDICLSLMANHHAQRSCTLDKWRGCWYLRSGAQSPRGCADRSGACGSSSRSDPRSWNLSVSQRVMQTSHASKAQQLVRTFTAGRLAGGDAQNLGRQADGASDLETLGFGTTNQLGAHCCSAKS